MDNFQTSLFYSLQTFIESSPLYRKYFYLFQALDLSDLPDRNWGVGCTGYSRRAMLRALIVKTLEGIVSIPRLVEYLQNHPVIAEMCDFNMMKKLPDESQFYRFLKHINNSVLEKIHHKINKTLIEQGVISMDTFILDSKPIMAASKDNNFKNPNRNTTNKKKPKRNPTATLSYYSYQEISGKKHFIFFWGYRTHVIVSKEGIPLIELTLPNNQTDAKVAKKLINKLKKVYGFKKKSIFIADAAYDEKDMYNFIVEQLKCQAFIPINPRNTQPEKNFSTKGLPLCEANLEMKSNGRFKEGNRERIKFRCPLKTDKKFAQKYPQGCPVNHPRFFEGKQSRMGGTKYLDITNDARAKIPRDSAFFKETYKLRTEVERYFSRLGNREIEQTTYYKSKAIKNQMTLAHMSLSLVAYAAAILMKKPDKIRCFRTFAQQPLAFKKAA